MLLTDPKILLLDEPTKGIDNFFKLEFAEILKDLKKQGVTIIMVSHDVEFCAKYADLVSMFFDGSIITTNTPNRFFSQNSFYTTAANRMSRHIFENAITNEDVIEFMQTESVKYWTLKRILGYVLILILMPVTLMVSWHFGDRKYYLCSLILIVYSIIPFLLSYEKRKPQARELVTIAVMCAIAVASRAAFIMLRILSTHCWVNHYDHRNGFGAEAGFLTGALGAFVSNFIFGQGPGLRGRCLPTGSEDFWQGFLQEKGS